MNNEQAAEIAAKGNAIIEAAKALAPDLSLSAVYNVLRPSIRRPDKVINATQIGNVRVQSGHQLTERDAVLKRELEVAQQSDDQQAVIDYWLKANALADKVAGIEAQFYACQPMSATRMLKILSQTQLVREGLNGPLRNELSGKPLAEMTVEHVTNWAAAGEAANAAA